MKQTFKYSIQKQVFDHPTNPTLQTSAIAQIKMYMVSSKDLVGSISIDFH
jgi:hypothetical protein